MADATTVELDAQYRQLREECGLLERSGRGKILVTGPDAAEYLQGQLTNDIEALAPAEGCYAALLDRKGHMQSDMRVLGWRTATSGSTSSPIPPTVLSHLRTYSIGREVEIEEVGEEWAILSLIGPRAAELGGFEGLGARARSALSAVGGDRRPRRRYLGRSRPPRSRRGRRRRPRGLLTAGASRSARTPPRSSGSSPGRRGSAPR